MLDDRKVYRIRTFHRTEMFLSSSLDILHWSIDKIPDDYIPIYAVMEGDNANLFFVKDKKVNYIQTFINSKDFLFGDKPVDIGVVKNADGSITFKPGNRFLSARQQGGRFDLRPKNLGWEHFTLIETEYKMNDFVEDTTLMVEESPNKDVYRVRTFHRTEMFLSKDMNIMHRSVENIPADYIPIYAVTDGDEAALFCFINNRVFYIQNLVGSNDFVFVETPAKTKILKNADGSITFKSGNRFLSARQQGGLFDLRPKDLAWEHFTLIKSEFTMNDLTENANSTPTLETVRYHHKMSIIIPMVDKAPVNTALKSIAAQTFDDYEVIISDGSRTDGASIDVELKNALGDKLSIIKADATANTIGALYNIGINLAVGRYVMLMGNEDELAPTALQELYTTADKTHADAIYCTQVENIERPLFDVANRIQNFVNGRLGWTARGRLLSREFLVRSHVEIPHLRAADEIVYSFYLACLARNYVLAPNDLWKLGAELEWRPANLRFFTVTNEALDVLDKFMNEQEFFARSPEYRYIVLDCVNEYCKKYLVRNNMTPYEFYEAVLKEVQANRLLFNKAAFLAYNFSTANWQYAQLLKKDREIRALNAEIQKAKEARSQEGK